MLQHIESRHFSALVGQACVLYLVDGAVLPVRIDKVIENPGARMQDEQRMPFTVTLTALESTHHAGSLCAIDLPELGRVEGIHVSRVAPLGRDPAFAYFCIIFN